MEYNLKALYTMPRNNGESLPNPSFPNETNIVM